jgi:hypothetical protein
MSPPPTCFVRKTRITTDRGLVPIEDLRIGDRVLTLRKRVYRQIRWIGRRRISTFELDTPELRRVHLPVRIKRGAFGGDVPCRDLYMSAGHGLILGEYGVSVRWLINGTTIAQVEDFPDFEYFNIELDSHDGIFAEQLSAETYVESDNRHAYDNAAEYEQLYPGDDPRLHELCCKIDVPMEFINSVRDMLDAVASRLELSEV